MVENELWGHPRGICVANERQCAIIEDKPLIIDSDGNDSMILRSGRNSRGERSEGSVTYVATA